MTESEEESYIHLPWENISPSGSLGMREEDISWELRKCQDTVRGLEMDILSLKASKESCEQEASALQQEIECLRRRFSELQDETSAYELTFQDEMTARELLLQDKQAQERELEKLARLYADQKELQKVPAAFPERRMVFKGTMEKEEMEGAPSDMVTVLPHIRYPILGGSALITFESPDVALQIIRTGRHRVQLDDFGYTSIWVKAEPVILPLPTSLEGSVERSPRQILVSGLPVALVPEEQLLDKLELFFSKRQNQGGEVERVERLSNSGHVALTFVEDGVVERLVQKGQFQVPIGKDKSYTIKVSHYVSGQLTNLQFSHSVCAQTVLLTGIPDVQEEQLMSGALLVHFQKPSKGGGEVEALVYIPAGRCAVAVFEGAEDGVAQLS